MRSLAGLACGLLVLVPTRIMAQTTPPTTTWYYGVSAGLGQRATRGAFLPSDEPTGAGQPPSPRWTAALDLEGGVGLTSRLVVVGMFEGGVTLNASQGWGSLATHAALRGWVTRRVWIEAGGGLAELAFRPLANPTSTTYYWWAPGIEAAGGYEIFHGPTVTLHVLVRYTEAQFETVRQQTLTFQIGLLGRAGRTTP